MSEDDAAEGAAPAGDPSDASASQTSDVSASQTSDVSAPQTSDVSASQTSDVLASQTSDVSASQTSDAPLPASAAPIAPPLGPRLGTPNALLIAWGHLVIINAVTIARALPINETTIGRRALHHVYDGGQLLAVGFASAVATALWGRLRLDERLGKTRAFALDLAAIAAASITVGFLILDDDVGNLAGRLIERAEGTRFGALILPLLIIAVSLIVPLAAALGRLLDRAYFRWIGLAGLVAAGVTNQLILRNDYPGAHLYLAWAGATLGAAALAGLRLAPSPDARGARIAGWLVHGALGFVAAYAVVTWPGGKMMSTLTKVPGAILAPYLFRIHRSTHFADTRYIAPEARVWFADRSAAPPVPPSAPSAEDARRIVIMLFVDSFRADVLATPSQAATLPAIQGMAQRGVSFTQARSPGNGTVFAFTQTFAGRYFSELYWTVKAPTGGYFPHEDPSPRFPSLLAAAGIPTVTFASAIWLVNEFGVVRGFTEETVINPEAIRTRAPDGHELIDPAILRLDRHGSGPLFLFVHFMDAHFPYDRAGTFGTPFDRYLRELQLVDKQIGRLRAAIDERGLGPRTTIILTADHGEAFGEHGSTQHGTTLYDELVHVPLIIEGAGVQPATIDQLVSLIDLGPTVLDWMGQPTPGDYLGQSLAPFLRGARPTLTRPILAESRLKQSLLFTDKIKVIRDQRTGTEETYDLAHDPLERKNLLDGDDDESMRARMGALEVFFSEHRLKRPGYVPPYRP